MSRALEHKTGISDWSVKTANNLFVPLPFAVAAVYSICLLLHITVACRVGLDPRRPTAA